MIPDEAIELALIANWDTEGDQKERMRAALEAAHPVLLAELRKAREALARVEGHHKRVEGYQFGAIPGAEPDWPVCSTCFTEDEHPQPWPCPTAAAVAAAKGDEHG